MIKSFREKYIINEGNSVKNLRKKVVVRKMPIILFKSNADNAVFTQVKMKSYVWGRKLTPQ